MPLTWPLEQQGSTGENVRSFQYLLNAHMSAGSAATMSAGAPGSAGETSEPASKAAAAVTVAEAAPSVTGTAATEPLVADGIFGPQTDGTFTLDTDAVVRHFQGFCQLSIDGMVGPNTWNALTLEWLRASGGQPAAELVFQAWSQGNRTTARYEAIPPAVDLLFARTYEAGWTFGGCQVTGATFACTWQRTGDKLILEGNNSTEAPFYFVTNVASEI